MSRSRDNRVTARPDLQYDRSEPITVLHVDDDAQLLRLTSEFLEREVDRLTVRCETDASSGLECLENTDVDAIVSDYNMPGMDGLEFLERVRTEYPEIPFVIYTGKGNEEIAGDAISAGVSDYLQKGTGTNQYTVLANRIVNAVEQYRSRRALAMREESLARAQRIADLGSWHWDVAAETLYWSDQIYRIFGVDPEEFDATYEAFLEFVHPDDRNTVRRAVDAALSGEDTYDIQHRIVRMDGEERIVHERAEVVRNDGEAIAMNGTVQDVSDRVSLKRRLDVFQEVVEHSGHSIFWTDRDGTIQYVNRTFEEITGYPSEEAIGRNPRILQSGEHDDGFYRDMWETILAGETWRNEIVNETKSGERYVVDQTIAPVGRPDGEPERFVAVNAPVSE